MPAGQTRRGRHREQYSCTECFRRKQKCNRTFPCNNCVARRLPNRCLPPSEHDSVRRSATLRNTANGHAQHVSDSDNQQHGIDLDTPPTSVETAITHDYSNTSPSIDQNYAEQSVHGVESHMTQEPASIRVLADIASRLGSLETSLAARGMLEQSEISGMSDQSAHSPHFGREIHVTATQGASPNGAQPMRSRMNVENSHAHHIQQGSSSTLLLDDWLASRSQPHNDIPALYSRQRQENQSTFANTPRRLRRFGTAPQFNSLTQGIQTPTEIDHEAPTSSPEYEVAANWVSNPVAIATNPTLRHVGPGYGLVVPISHLELIYKALPTFAECRPITQSFLSCFNISNVPLQSSYVHGILQKLSITLPAFSIKDTDPSPTPSSMLRPYSALLARISQVALLLAILVLGSLKPSQRILPTTASRKFFYACKTALSLCECVGVATYDSCWAHALLARYLELVRVPRGAWTHAVSISRDAIDLNLHSAMADRKMSRAAKAARRLLWLQVILKDREWSAIYGRPFSYGGPTINLPTAKDFELLNVDLRCSLSLLARAEFMPCIKAIANLQQSMHASPTSDGNRFDQKSYEQAFVIDAQIETYLDSLPPCLRSLLDEEPDALSDAKDLYLRHTVVEPVLFFRTLLHRPFMLCLADEEDRTTHTYPHSRSLCTSLALQSQRCLARLRTVLPPALASQHYACAFSTFNADIILGQSIVQGLLLGEYESNDSVAEKLNFILQYVIEVRQNIEDGIGDHFAAKEALVMRYIHGRLVTAIRQRARLGTLPSAFEDFLYASTTRVSHLINRIGKELSAAETTLRQMDPGVRVDRGNQHSRAQHNEEQFSIPTLLDDTSLFMSMASIPRFPTSNTESSFDIVNDSSNIDAWTSDFFRVS